MSETGEAGLGYARRGWMVLPIHRVGPDGSCSCSTGAACKSPGKHPRTASGLKDASTEPATVQGWFSTWPDSNLGIVTGAVSDLLVLDVDGEEGERSLEQLCTRYGQPPATLTARTGGGGRHLFFRHPGSRVGNRAGFAPRLDVRGDGGYVVAPPSLHRSGRSYAWLNDVQPASPDWLMRVLAGEDARKKADRTVPSRTPLPDRELVLRRASAYLATIPPAVAGQGGHNQTFLAAQHLVRGFGLAEEEALQLLREEYNPHCLPPWSEDELRHKVADAANNSSQAWGYLLTEERPAPRPQRRARPELVEPDWLREIPPPEDPGPVLEAVVIFDAPPAAGSPPDDQPKKGKGKAKSKAKGKPNPAEQQPPVDLEDTPEALFGFQITLVRRRSELDESSYDVIVVQGERTVMLRRIDSKNLFNYSAFRPRIANEGLSTPLLNKALRPIWDQWIDSLCVGANEIALRASDESVGSSAKEQIVHWLASRDDGQGAADLQRGRVVRFGDRLHADPTHLISCIRALMPDDRPERSTLVDAAVSLGMVESRPRLPDGTRPRVWSFPSATVDGFKREGEAQVSLEEVAR